MIYIRKQSARQITGDGPKIFQPTSVRMEVDEGWKIRVAQYQARSDESGWRTFDLNTLWLPPTELFGPARRLTQQPELCETICIVMNDFLTRQKWTKSTNLVASTKVQMLAKFFEYCWLNGIYRMRDWPAEMWTEFLEKYKNGGWSNALDLRARAKRVAGDFDLSEVLSNHRPDRLSVRTRFLEAIGTNARGPELIPIRQVFQEKFKLVVDDDHPSTRAGISFSNLVKVTSDLGALAEVPVPYGITSVPTDNPYLYAQLHGRPQSRTKNISPKQLAILLSKSYRWINEYGPSIVSLSTALSEQLPREGLSKKILVNLRARVLRGLPETAEVERLLGISITGFERDRFGSNTTVSTLLKMTATACFILIAVFNGRRRDEVVDSRIGLYDGALKCVSRELGVYECAFYIEKTDLEYVPFYVNEITRKAIELMESLSRLVWGGKERTNHKQKKERKLFALPVLTLRRNSESWYEYTGNSTRQFLRWAFGEDEPCLINAHMFRRAYAVVYHYRYENATLLALSWQLRHRDLNMTSHYFLDPPTRPLPERADRIWAMSEAARKAQVAHSTDLAEEIGLVGKDKLREVVQDILTGSRNFSGGFPKLIARFHQKLGKHLEYDKLSLQQQSMSLAKLLLERGHKPVPFGHGDCNAGPAKFAAGCFSSKENILQKHRASPEVCHRCPYHSCTDSHVLALRREAEEMRQQLEQHTDSVRMYALRNDLESLSRVIQLHERRLNK